MHMSPVLIGMWYCAELNFKDTVKERTVPFVKLPEACGLHLQGMGVSLLNIEAVRFFAISNFCPYKTTPFLEGSNLQSNSRISNLPCRTLKCTRRQRGKRAAARRRTVEPHNLLYFERCKVCRILFSCASVRFSGHCLNVWRGFWSVFIHLIWYLLL